MAFTIEERDTAETPAIQSVWYASDIDALVRGAAGVGVLTGCTVTAQGSPDMTVAVAAGTIQAEPGATAVAVTGGNVNITAAHATLPRLDIVSAAANGTKTVTDGTAASDPEPPALPAGHVYLAQVYVPAAVTTITTARITDKRVIIPAHALRGAAAKSQSTAGARTVSATTAGTALGGVSDLTLAAVAGDWIEIGVSLRPVATTAQSIRFDVASIVSAAIVNYVSNGTGTAATTGVAGWFCASAVMSGVGGSVLYQVQAGDLDGGNIVLRLIAWVSASTRDVEAQAASPLMWWAKNLGQ